MQQIVCNDQKADAHAGSAQRCNFVTADEHPATGTDRTQFSDRLRVTMKVCPVATALK